MGFASDPVESKTVCPARVIEPASGARYPAIIRMVVVLPAPLGPSRPVIWPGWSRKDRSRTARVEPKDLDAWVTLIMLLEFVGPCGNSGASGFGARRVGRGPLLSLMEGYSGA